MGITKSEIFSDKQNEMAKIAKVLGHPARISILEYLIKSSTCVCGDLVDEIGLAQPTISQHLKELKNAGIIKGTIEGTSVCYCIDIEKWKAIQSMLNLFFDQALPCTDTDCC
ncbi:winged helix-turn-helix transcriptional regulator [Formosa sediminum]|uniref:Winged helix-turn-helix transcriptional regulator n=1 Tax=Formosa sediminum TaxID=2594004 RepID=A0A516GTY6_9FLAO|nr:metalloregulator ArsR/SmtB family transcription factor [Formosa sediminum]QDO94979.1 winged helix-turn-helix transcriptional regulator [Formosa sediminum]